jgi:hypothetical protein
MLNAAAAEPLAFVVNINSDACRFRGPAIRSVCESPASLPGEIISTRNHVHERG